MFQNNNIINRLGKYQEQIYSHTRKLLELCTKYINSIIFILCYDEVVYQVVCVNCRFSKELKFTAINRHILYFKLGIKNNIVKDKVICRSKTINCEWLEFRMSFGATTKQYLAPT